VDRAGDHEAANHERENQERAHGNPFRAMAHGRPSRPTEPGRVGGSHTAAPAATAI